MILAYDPGGTTGVAVLLDDGNFSSWEIQGTFEEQSKKIVHQLSVYCPDVVVCESFIITPNTGKLGSDEQKYYPLMLIGVIRRLCDDFAIPVVMQTPSQRKFATDDKLKKLVWYSPSKGGHKNDAARHLLTYLANNKHEPTLRRLVA